MSEKIKNLISLLAARSKHSEYQEIFPELKKILGIQEMVVNGRENSRWNFMLENFNWHGARVIDIGANTGYFSMAAIQAQAKEVLAIEGNVEHAQFIRSAAKMLNFDSRIKVEQRYFEASNEEFIFCDVNNAFDVVLYLNVVHHFGDDFGSKYMLIDDSLNEMRCQIQNISKYGEYCWFQMGFNWKGDRQKPLFSKGLKSELVNYVKLACNGFWDVKSISVYNEKSQAYEEISERLMTRFDNLGEFLNRPLFLLKKTRAT